MQKTDLHKLEINNQNTLHNIVVLIPAYNPDENILLLINSLKQHFRNIIVIDDGSYSKEKFQNLDVKILSHSQNFGKGEALKTGFKWILENLADCNNIITADCDMQHLPEDIVQIASFAEKEPNKLYLGYRTFNKKHVPIKSRFGNYIASLTMRIFKHINLKDTQSGLRGIPKELAKSVLEINSTGFAFETKFLIKAKQLGVSFQEVPIQTIYNNKNKNTHFKALKDSIEILKVIIGKD